MPRGRRPGKADTRAQIVAAAEAAFASEGYAQASLRGIAQRASVDPALVHHYFDGKAALFVEVTGLPRDFREIRDEVDRTPGPRGTALVDRFLRYWDEEPPEGRANTFLSLMQAVSSSTQAAASFKQFLVDRVWSQVARDPDDPDWLIRRALVGSQLVGLGFQRYVLLLEPLASADPAEVAGWVGPTIDRYMAGPLEAAPAPDSSRRSRRARPRARRR
jgi:AcrR family transcriptional regulator